MMKTNVILLLIYSAILVVGGFFGFLKAGSLASLITSSISALAILLTTHFVHRGSKKGELAAFSLLALLLGFFIYRFFNTGHFMPAGLLSLLTAGLLAFQYRYTFQKE